MSQKPAIMGGAPMFEKRMYIVRPVLPSLDDMTAELKSILGTGMVTKGDYLRRFEEACAEHLGVKHAVGVSSCTTGLMLTYKGLGLSGGEAIVPSFTFMATVSSMVWTDVTPVYVDVVFGTTNIDVSAIEAAITPRTKAIVAVHNFGNPADVDELVALAKKHNLKLVFDAAHGFGTLYQGNKVGTQGNAQVYSLSPTKLLIAGEGGIVATNDDALADYIRLGREYGNDGKYDSAFAGMNARMPEFNAALALQSLKQLEQAAQNRNAYLERFKELLKGLPGLSFQDIKPGNRSSLKDFALMLDPDKFGLSRDELSKAVQAENIDTRHYYDPAVHNQTAYKHFYQGQPLPNTVKLEKNGLSLPLYSHMTDEEIEKIARAVIRIHEHAAAVRA